VIKKLVKIIGEKTMIKKAEKVKLMK